MGKAAIETTPSGEQVTPAAATNPPFPAGNPQLLVQVRLATIDDVSWILDDLKDFAKFYGTKKSVFPSDRDVAAGIVTRLITQHLFIVAQRDNETPMGFIAGFVTPHVFNPEITMLAESLWWVKPEFRGSRAGKALLMAFTEWGKQNADWISFTLEHHSPVKDEVLLKRGFHLQEKTYLMECE